MRPESSEAPALPQKIYDAPPLEPDFYYAGLEGKRVLDLGCGTGNLGDHFKKTGAEWYGVTFSEAEAAAAREKLKQVTVLDIEGQDSLPFQNHFFDAVVFADVLEHLRNPSRALNLVKPYLKPGGRIIASIPNVANFKIRFALLCGKFQYEPFGIMDNTHLRFYTLETAKELIASNGYNIQSIKYTTWNWKFPKWFRPLISAEQDRSLRRFLLNLSPGFFATQFVINAVLKS